MRGQTKQPLPGALCSICRKRRTYYCMPNGDPICDMCKTAIFEEQVRNLHVVIPKQKEPEATQCQDRILLVMD